MANDWKDWTGGKFNKRHADVIVEVRFRNGLESRQYPAGELQWEWGGRFPENYAFDIVAYRKVAEE